MMAHDGRWTVGWCKQSMCGWLDDGKWADYDKRARSRGGGDWGKTAPTGGPRLPVTAVQEMGGGPTAEKTAHIDFFLF
jgi:hypothetical protein